MDDMQICTAEEKAKKCPMKINDFIGKYKALHHEKLSSQSESLVGRIMKTLYSAVDIIYTLHEDGSEVQVISPKSDNAVELLKVGNVVRVNGSPGKFGGILCLYAASFDLLADESFSQPSSPTEKSAHRHFDILSTHEFRWKFMNGITIIQPPIKQAHNKCAFAAVSRQIEYQLRIEYAKAGVSLRQGSLFDHIQWDDKSKCKFPDRAERWKPQELLFEAQTDGLPLWNGGSHAIQFIRSLFKTRANTKEFMVELKNVLKFFPVVGVMKVNSNFNEDGCDVYTIGGEAKFEKLFKNGKMVDVFCYHAVVLLDFCECEDILYIAYQNCEGHAPKSMCDNGITWMEADLLVELHYGCSLPPIHPPQVLQSKDQISETLYYISIVNEGSKKYNHLFNESQRLIEDISRSCNEKQNADLVKDWNNKLVNHIEDLRNIVKCMFECRCRFEGSLQVAKTDVKVLSDLMETCKKAEDIAKRADHVELLHKKAVIQQISAAAI